MPPPRGKETHKEAKAILRQWEGETRRATENRSKDARQQSIGEGFNPRSRMPWLLQRAVQPEIEDGMAEGRPTVGTAIYHGVKIEPEWADLFGMAPFLKKERTHIVQR